MTVHLDTHVVVWLYAGEADRLSSHARRLIDSEPVLVSPMVELELALLFEIGRITAPSEEVLTGLGRSLGLAMSGAAFTAVAAAAGALAWTRDPFDRIICGQAIVERTPLVTRDRRIREHLDLARWD